jgi:hypothetical protein
MRTTSKAHTQTCLRLPEGQATPRLSRRISSYLTLAGRLCLLGWAAGTFRRLRSQAPVQSSSLQYRRAPRREDGMPAMGQRGTAGQQQSVRCMWAPGREEGVHGDGGCCIVHVQHDETAGVMSVWRDTGRHHTVPQCHTDQRHSPLKECMIDATDRGHIHGILKMGRRAWPAPFSQAGRARARRVGSAAAV